MRRGRHRIAAALGRVKVQHHAGQGLAQLVVQLAGDQGALAFLGHDQAGRQPLETAVGRFEFESELLLLGQTLPLDHHPFDDLRQGSKLVLGEVILGAASQHVHGGFLADGAGHDDQRGATAAGDQDLQRRIRREARHVVVAQDRVEIPRDRAQKGIGIIDPLQLVAALRVGPLQRQLHQFDVVGVVFHAQQADGFGRCGGEC